MTEKNFSEYGNNYFRLQGGAAGAGSIDGILTELPALNMSTDWVAGPMESINGFFDELLNNDFVEFLAMNANSTASNDTAKYHRYLGVGENTSRTYNGCSRLSFDLKWRVYAGQKIGTQKTSNYDDCLKFIKNLVPSDTMSQVSIGNLADNIICAADGAAEIVKAGTESYSNSAWAITSGMAASGMVRRYKENAGRTNAASGGNVITSGGGANETAAWNTTNSGANFGYTSITAASNDTTLKTYNDSFIRGANLCTLHIYDSIFPSGIKVNVKSFNVTPAKEWNEDANQNYYYDFEVNCETNEIHSVNNWIPILKVGDRTS